MNQGEFNQLLKLAKQIGGQAWNLLVESQVIIGIQEIIGASLLFLGVILGIVIAAFVYRKYRKAEAEKERYNLDKVDYFAPIVISLIVSLILLAFAIPTMMDGIGHVLFPQVYAIQSLLPQQSS